MKKITGNFIGEAGIRMMNEALCVNTTLTKLEISGYIQSLKVIKDKFVFKCYYLTGILSQLSSLNVLVTMIQSNSLTSLNMSGFK